MIMGAHLLLYSSDVEADPNFFRDVIGFRSVDDGGWLIFALPPSEAAVHPSGDNSPLSYAGQEMIGAVLFLICDDLGCFSISAQRTPLASSDLSTAGIGASTTIRLPSGGRIGLYQPTHQTPLGLGSMQNFGALE